MVSDLATVVVCERWTMPVGQQDETSQWFLDWVLRRPNESSTHVTAGFHAYAALPEVYPGPQPFATATEYFGGLGCQALMIQSMFAPPQHVVVERHPLAAFHLRSLLRERPGVEVVEGDAFAVNHPADLVGLDFGNLTALKAQREFKPLLDQVFAAQPKAVVLTDIAGQRLHLLRERYQDLLAHDCSTYPEYLHGLVGYFLGAYDYQAVSCFHHRWSAVMTLVPARLVRERGIEPRIGLVPADPEGLRLR